MMRLEKRDGFVFDTTHMFKENLEGEKGISREEVSSLEERTEEIHQDLFQARERGELGFTELIRDMPMVQEIEEVAEGILPWCENFVIFGMGGSALGNLALFRGLRPPHYNLFENLRGGRPRLFITNNVDPVEWRVLLENLDLTKTVFNVISKSGSTAETMALYLIAKDLLEREVGDSWPEHFIFTTSKEKGELYNIKERMGITSLPIPENVGGRFSLFSAVGLLSSCVVGISIKEVLKGAVEMDNWCSSDSVWENPAYLKAILQYLAVKKGKNISIIMPYSHSLEYVADWYLQLAGESLGKRYTRDGEEVYTGYTPVKAVGATDQHSQLQLYMEGPDDKVITFLTVGGLTGDLEIPRMEKGDLSYLGGHSLGHLLMTEKRGTEEALARTGRMTASIHLPSLEPTMIGQLLYMMELEIAFAGELYNINAFDQPGVELGKNLTRKMLGRQG